MCCILSGCDYVPSLYGIGIRKAAKIIERVGSDINQVINLIHLSSYYLMSSQIIRILHIDAIQGKLSSAPTEDYHRQLERAIFAFKHQWVFNPVTVNLHHVLS